MSNTSKAVDVLTKMIVEVAQNAIENASYDKTTFGVVKKKTPSGISYRHLEKSVIYNQIKILVFMNESL